MASKLLSIVVENERVNKCIGLSKLLLRNTEARDCNYDYKRLGWRLVQPLVSFHLEELIVYHTISHNSKQATIQIKVEGDHSNTSTALSLN